MVMKMCNSNDEHGSDENRYSVMMMFKREHMRERIKKYLT